MKPSFATTFVALALSTTLLAQAKPSPSAQPPSRGAAQAGDSEMERRVDEIMGRLSLEQKIDLLGGIRDFYIRGFSSVGVPEQKMSDGPLGLRNDGPSTTVGGIALAATWNEVLGEQVGRAFGEDARARGVHFLLGPGVNIYRAPMGGRNFEYLGEDPFLAARMTVGYIEGVQSQGVVATVKHFMGNNSEYDRHNTDAEIDERTMHEIYLPAFEAAVREAKVGAIMDSYNLVNGEHATQNPHLNIDIAKRDWNFAGIIMSDWDATYDGVAAVNSGLDLEMPSGKLMNRETLLPAIKQGRVKTDTVDEHVRRILRNAIRFGFLDRPQLEPSIPLMNPEGERTALQVVRESFVLLKNDGHLLPLDKRSIKTIAVIGPDAYPAQPDGGGSAHSEPFHAVSYLEGITEYVGAAGGGTKVLYHRGLKTWEEMAKATEFTTDSNGGEAGLRVEEFEAVDLSGQARRTAVEEHVNRGSDSYDAKSAVGSIRWTGYYTAHTGGQHDFFVLGPGENGGFRLFVDDKLVVDNWERATAILNYATLSLDKGTKHKVRLELFSRDAWGPKKLAFGVLPQSEAVDDEAKAIARLADAVVVFPGFNASIETEAGDRMFRLPPGQDELITEMLAANKKTVVVLTAGGGVDMSKWIDSLPALLHGWYSGEQGGRALAEIIFGEVNPSGRLPISIERRWEDNATYHSYYPNDGPKRVKYSEGVFLGYRHFEHDNVKPLFPFGYGLSYANFAYHNLNVSPGTSSLTRGPVTVSFDVTNTGSRAGAEVAELYVGDSHSSVPRPPKELKGFAKMYLDPGQTKRAEIQLDFRSFAYYDVKTHGWKADPGNFKIMVGPSSADVALQGDFSYQPIP